MVVIPLAMRILGDAIDSCADTADPLSCARSRRRGCHRNPTMIAAALIASTFAWRAAPLPHTSAIAAAPRSTPLAMQLGRGLPPEVAAILEPAYKGAARGGTPFVLPEKEVRAIWSAMVKVYGSQEDARAAVRKNQQVILPYINTPECIVGANAALVGIFGKEGAAEIIRKNPGVLACNPTALAATSRGDIERAANVVAWVDGLDPNLKQSIPFLWFLLLVGTVGGRVVTCSSGACGSAADWDLKGGLGVQLTNFITSNLPF